MKFKRDFLIVALITFCLTTSLLMVRTTQSTPPASTQESTTIAALPYPTSGTEGTAFVVNVVIQNVQNLMGIHFRLTWDPSILQASSITEVLFHAITPQEYWDNIWTIILRYNNTEGWCEYAVTWQDFVSAIDIGYAPFNGSQTVATIVLTGLRAGTTNLTFDIVEVGDVNANPISCTPVDSTITVSLGAHVHVIPEETTLSHPWTLFTVNVTYEDLQLAQNVIGYQFRLEWNSSILQCVSITEVAFNAAAPPGEEDNIWIIQLRRNNTAGTAEYAVTWMDVLRAQNGGYAYISGNGTWATLTFNSTAPGETFLNLTVSYMGDASWNSIPH